MRWPLHLAVFVCTSTPAALSADSVVPEVIVPLDIDETSIAAGIEHSCAIQTQSYEDVGGRVVCWGVDNGGQSSPPPGDFIQVSAGRLHSCGIRIDETLECWGIGAPVSKPEGLFEQVSSGDFHSCGIMKDQTVKCWGVSIGDEERLDRHRSLMEGVLSVDQQVQRRQVSPTPQRASSCRSAAAKTFPVPLQRTVLSSVGARMDMYGELGVNLLDMVRDVLLLQGQLNVNPITRFRQISASPGDFVCGVTEDNSLSCWGDNHRGQASPPTDEKFILVSTSRLAACGVKMDKTTVCWGMQSGVTAAPTDVQFDELTLGWNHGCGIRFEDGGVQCWGDRGSNRLEIPEALR